VHPSDPAVIRLIGPFAIERADGVDVTPHGKRSKALLAMLALAPKGTRARKWLQSKLWSTRGEEQGAASLRQELFELRKSLQDEGIDVLSADRDVVHLDMQSIEVDCLRAPADLSATQELLEGLDVGDPEFEEWLRDQRSEWHRLLTRGSEHPVAAARGAKGSLLTYSSLCLGLVHENRPDDPTGTAIGNLVLDLVARSILNFEVVDVMDFRVQNATWNPQSEAALPDWLLQIKTSVLEGGVCVTLGLLAPGDNHLLWTHTEFLELVDLRGAESLRLMSFVNQVVFAVLDLILNPQSIRNEPRHQASRLAFAAIRQVFRIRDKDLDAAERMLAEAHALHPKSTYLAWLLFVFITRFGERWVGRSGAFHDQVREYAHRAVEADAFNPITLALTAHTYSFVFREYGRALELADRAVAINPAQAICWDMRALTLGYLGEVEEGYRDAMRARALGGPPLYRYCIDTTCCILSTLNGHFEEGIRHAERVLAQQPAYLPALRYSAACYGHLGRTAEAVRTVGRLREREPDFSLELLSDQDYPIAGVLGVSVIHRGLSQIALPKHAGSVAA
jgi:tetratricopeptide (TPR) repeat protein